MQKQLPKLIITCLFSSQMPFSAISKVCDSLPTEGPDPIFPVFHIWEHFHLFDKMVSLSFCHFNLVFKCPLLSLFISELNSFLFHKVYYFLATLSFLLTFSLLAFRPHQKK